MRSRVPFSALRFISVALLLLAVLLTTFELVRFSRLRAYYPPGMTIAGVPVNGLDRQQAAQRVLEAYAMPVELHYNDAVIQVTPGVVDFQLDMEGMLAAASLQRNQTPFWEDFWDFLWARSSNPPGVPLRATSSETRLRAYLAGIAKVYDQPPQAAVPVAGSVNFQPGRPGSTLDVDGSLPLIEAALRSLNRRTVDLPITRTNAKRPALLNLQVLLKQTIGVSGFDGVAGIYLLDLQTAQELHFAVENGQDLPVQPDIAFTASSIMKIPILVSVFNHLNGDPDAETIKLMSDMIDKSGNEAADWLMDRVIGPKKAPLAVSQDMKAIGLDNTFLAGYFSLGSPQLATFVTPANSRRDINTNPDPYSQTTPSDIGMLLEDLYQCAERGGGALPAVFPGKIDQVKCQKIVDYLIANKLPALLTAGLPEGTQIAHKHGWVSTNGIINTIGDAGIIYSPGGAYIMSVFLYHPQQLVWEPASTLVAELSRAAYNYFNLPEQAGQ
ncbi:MAG TPA: serine hydrolase [Anaerolineales bacterium]